MAQLKITQVRSTIRYATTQKDTLKALGIRRMHQSVIKEDNAAIRGMVAKVRHLVSVEEVQA